MTPFLNAVMGRALATAEAKSLRLPRVVASAVLYNRTQKRGAVISGCIAKNNHLPSTVTTRRHYNSQNIKTINTDNKEPHFPSFPGYFSSSLLPTLSPASSPAPLFSSFQSFSADQSRTGRSNTTAKQQVPFPSETERRSSANYPLNPNSPEHHQNHHRQGKRPGENHDYHGGRKFFFCASSVAALAWYFGRRRSAAARDGGNSDESDVPAQQFSGSSTPNHSAITDSMEGEPQQQQLDDEGTEEAAGEKKNTRKGDEGNNCNATGDDGGASGRTQARTTNVDGPTTGENEAAAGKKRDERRPPYQKNRLHETAVFAGTAGGPLAEAICAHLGHKLGGVDVTRFADGEVGLRFKDSVRGKDVYIVQPTSPPVNENLMELLLMISTLRRSSAKKITAVIPYYGYARQDRKMNSRVPISAADVARMIEVMGADRVISVDLHSGQIQGFFGPGVPVDNLEAGIVGLKYFVEKKLVNPVIVSPDAGGVYRARKFQEGLGLAYRQIVNGEEEGTEGLRFAQKLFKSGKYINDQTKEKKLGAGLKRFVPQDVGLAMLIKQRLKANEIERMDLVGDVTNADCIIVDDMIDTAGTLCEAAKKLKMQGARRVFAFATHGVFSGKALERINSSVLEEVVVTDSVPMTPEIGTCPRIYQLSIAKMLAEVIRRIHNKESLESVFVLRDGPKRRHVG